MEAHLTASSLRTAQPQSMTVQSPFHLRKTRPRRRRPPPTSIPTPLPESRCIFRSNPCPINDPILVLVAIQTMHISQVQCHTIVISLGLARIQAYNRKGSIGGKLDSRHSKRDLEPYLPLHANQKVVAINDLATLECSRWLYLRMNLAKPRWNGL